jgi:multiple sugar transport system permease protein
MLRALRVYSAVLLLLILVAFPLYWMAVTSFKPQTEVFRTPPTFLPETWTLRHYAELFWLTDFGLLFLNSLKVCLLSTGLALIVGSLGAYALSRARQGELRASGIDCLHVPRRAADHSAHATVSPARPDQ